MSEEEKKAIEKIRSFNQYNWEMNNLKEKEFAKPYFDALDTILNLIEKQQEEIKRLKYSIAKATEIIDEYANEVENDTKKIIEYREKYLDNEGD